MEKVFVKIKKRYITEAGNMQAVLNIDKVDGIEYENSPWPMKILRIPAASILNVLPRRISKHLMEIFSSPRGGSSDVSKSPTTYRAIEAMYTYPERRKRGETSIFDYFWFYLLNNPQALRNRLLLTIHQLIAKIKDVAEKKERVYLLSLGCGSTRAVIMALSKLDNQIKARVKIKLLDTSRDAIKYAQNLAKENRVNDHGQFEWYRDNLQNLEKYCDGNFCPDIVEMVGILDYFNREQTIKIISKIYKALSPNGWLVTCNICQNLESPFITKGAGWPMVYRNPQELSEIIAEGGFFSSNIRIISEPLKIHTLAVAKKKLHNP